MTMALYLLVLVLWKLKFYRFSKTDKMFLTPEAEAMLQKAALKKT